MQSQDVILHGAGICTTTWLLWKANAFLLDWAEKREEARLNTAFAATYGKDLRTTPESEYTPEDFEALINWLEERFTDEKFANRASTFLDNLMIGMSVLFHICTAVFLIGTIWAVMSGNEGIEVVTAWWLYPLALFLMMVFYSLLSGISRLLFNRAPGQARNMPDHIAYMRRELAQLRAEADECAEP